VYNIIMFLPRLLISAIRGKRPDRDTQTKETP
jgi:hypothetical protein